MSQRLTAVFPLHVGGTTISSYSAIDALIINLAISVILTIALDTSGRNSETDQTMPADYEAD
jgi:solute:Na+ symporter, SSS family